MLKNEQVGIFAENIGGVKADFLRVDLSGLGSRENLTRVLETTVDVASWLIPLTVVAYGWKRMLSGGAQKSTSAA